MSKAREYIEAVVIQRSLWHTKDLIAALEKALEHIEFADSDQEEAYRQVVVNFKIYVLQNTLDTISYSDFSKWLNNELFDTNEVLSTSIKDEYKAGYVEIGNNYNHIKKVDSKIIEANMQNDNNIIEYYALEEMSELQKEITKILRNKPRWENFKEELADVYYILSILQQKYDITDNEINKCIASKEQAAIKDLGV
jgi:NTP pyrophosphatase (non-canonical NTP hydrolase)